MVGGGVRHRREYIDVAGVAVDDLERPSSQLRLPQHDGPPPRPDEPHAARGAGRGVMQHRAARAR